MSELQIPNDGAWRGAVQSIAVTLPELGGERFFTRGLSPGPPRHPLLARPSSRCSLLKALSDDELRGRSVADFGRRQVEQGTTNPGTCRGCAGLAGRGLRRHWRQSALHHQGRLQPSRLPAPIRLPVIVPDRRRDAATGARHLA